MLPLSTARLDSSIALEIMISEPLFCQLQAVLDANPTLSLDQLASQALSIYLRLLPDPFDATRPLSKEIGSSCSQNGPETLSK